MAASSSSSTVPCSICLHDVSDGCGRTVVKLRCDHVFHLDCIGSAFNAKGAMECPNCRVNENGVWRMNFGSPTAEQNLTDEADQDVDDPQESIPMGPHGNVLHPHYGWEDAWGSAWGYGNLIEQLIADATNQWNSSFMMSDVIPSESFGPHTHGQMGPFLSGYGNAINPHAGNANTHQWNGPPVPTEMLASQVPQSTQRYGICDDCINRISVQRYGICNDCLNQSSVSGHAGIPVPAANLRISSADGNGIPIPSAGFNGIQNDMRMPMVIIDEILNQSVGPQVNPEIILVHHVRVPYPGHQAAPPHPGHQAAPPHPGHQAAPPHPGHQAAPPAPPRNHNRRTA